MKYPIDLPIEIKLPVNKFTSLDEIEEDLDDLDDDIYLDKDDLLDDLDFEEELESEVISDNHLIKIEDIQKIRNANNVSELIGKLGYPSICLPVHPSSYDIYKDRLNIYLLADCNNRSSNLQVILCVLNDIFPAESFIKIQIQSILTKLCRRASDYLIFATVNFKQLCVFSPQKKLDKDWNLKLDVESIFIDLLNPSYYDRNWLEKLVFDENLAFSVKSQYDSIKTAKQINRSQENSRRKEFTEDSIRIYLQEIGRIRLLRADEEIELSSKIQDLLYLEKIREELADEFDCQPDDVREADWAIKMGMPLGEFRKRLHSGRRAKDKMVQSSLRLGVSIAKRYMNRGLDFQDLIQEGSFGLIRAAEKFDHKKGYKFSTYATWWIRQAITRAIADYSRTIRLPVYIWETFGRIKKTIELLAQEMGRKPTEVEIACCMEMTVEKLRFIAKSSQPCISLFTPINKEGEDCICDLIEFENETPEQIVTMSLLREDLEFVLGSLSSRERDVLRLRYGLHDGRIKTLEEIGRIFNVTRERIRQIEAKALRKLRHLNRNGILKEYIH